MIKFGTGGWRAIIGEEFIMDNVKLLAQGLANDIDVRGYMESPVIIGCDRRFLSNRAAKWLSAVLAGNGIRVLFIEKFSPTPLIMFAVKETNTKYGIAITASHNPAHYNGVKIFTQGGRDATEDVTENLENIIETLTVNDIKEIPFNEGVDKGIIKFMDPLNDYLDDILNVIDVDAIKKQGLRILIDPMFGVSKACLQTILLTARCDVDIINDRHDTLFGGRMPSPNAASLGKLKDMVVEREYDLGVGTDGDADRIGIIDRYGKFIHPNDIMVLLYYYLLKYKGWKGGAVRNIATTHLLDKVAKAFGEECYEVPVGFKHISSKMEEKDALIGGESSGGLTIRGHIKGKDGIFAASLLVELISVTDKSLSCLLDEIHEKYGEYAMTEADFKFSEQEKEVLMKTLFEEKKLPEFNYNIKKVSYEDGVKVYFENDGWIIARFSGTEPLLRIFAEMSTIHQAEKVSDIMKEFLNLQ